jgi:hypothetical protein
MRSAIKLILAAVALIVLLTAEYYGLGSYGLYTVILTLAAVLIVYVLVRWF